MRQASPSEPHEANKILADPITLETDLFEHREVKPHFINPCCFGEDFAIWLKEHISSLTGLGFSFSEEIQEDYDWGFWARKNKDSFWVALSYVGNGPQEPPAQWVISIAYDPGWNVIKRLFHKPDAKVLEDLRSKVNEAVTSNPAIRIGARPRLWLLRK